MKPLRIVVLSLLVVSWAIPTEASTIPPDPVIRQGGFPDPACTPPFCPAPIFMTDFTIVSPSGTSGPAGGSACMLTEGTYMVSSPKCLFQDVIVNSSGAGENITKLVFDVGVGAVTCALLNNQDFATCTTAPFDDGGTMVTFSGGKGIPYQGQFTLGFQGFLPQTSFSGVAAATPIPEPNTLALFLAGIGALLIGRRLRTRSLS
jgi:hypothetical protein